MAKQKQDGTAAAGGNEELIISLPKISLIENVGYVPTHVDVRLRGNRPLSQWLKRLALTLEDRGATLSNGKLVRGCGPAVTWLLEQCASESNNS